MMMMTMIVIINSSAKNLTVGMLLLKINDGEKKWIRKTINLKFFSYFGTVLRFLSQSWGKFANA